MSAPKCTRCSQRSTKSVRVWMNEITEDHLAPGPITQSYALETAVCDDCASDLIASFSREMLTSRDAN